MKVARYVDLFAGGATLLFTVAFVAFNYALFTFLVAPLLDWLFGNGGAEQIWDFPTSSVRRSRAGRMHWGPRRRGGGAPADSGARGVPPGVGASPLGGGRGPHVQINYIGGRPGIARKRLTA